MWFLCKSIVRIFRLCPVCVCLVLVSIDSLWLHATVEIHRLCLTVSLGGGPIDVSVHVAPDKYLFLFIVQWCNGHFGQLGV